ncbi:MAG TPA: toast rack family protein [Candidatus Dormibacteraeota bacterium]|nr:toast rack family protein [Candidatus Dormibacteraeota bacterium]
MPNPNRRTSVVFPVILIALGGMFLYRSWRPDFDPWPLLWTYWPLILILIGLGKIWDYSQRRQIDPNTGVATDPGRAFSVGTTVAVLAFVLVLVVVLWHGSGSIRARNGGGFSRHEIHTVDAQGAKNVRASIQMGAGELTIGGETSHLLDGSFDFREGRGTPEVRYNVSNGTGELSVEETHNGPNIVIPGNNSTTWNLRFGDQLPLEMDINLGAGEGHLRLRGLPVTKLDLNIGAGRVDADLTGDRKKDLDADISGGVGEAVIRLPKNVGVVADVSGGLGSIDTHGLKKDGDQYTNDSYGHTPATIHLHISGGIGSISLTQEP